MKNEGKFKLLLLLLLNGNKFTLYCMCQLHHAGQKKLTHDA